MRPSHHHNCDCEVCHPLTPEIADRLRQQVMATIASLSDALFYLERMQRDLEFQRETLKDLIRGKS